MSSFTSKNVRDLYEAYNSVYVDETELFLNNILDTVTESVNELVNEGYDLSDYSWDEIYESFLENVLEPELQEVESFITQLNESSEELTEEQIENLLENPLLRGLSFFSRGPKVTGSGGVTIPRPQPTPGTGRPLRNPRQLELPVGQDKGSFARLGDWLSSLTSKGRAQQAAKPPAPAPTQPPSPKPTATTPASRQPSGTPSGTRLSDRIGTRVNQAWQALTKPSPRPHGPLASFGGVKDKILGTTKRGLATRLGVYGDVAGQLAFPDKAPYSPTVGAAGLGVLGAGAAAQGLAGLERFGQRGPDGKYFGRGAYETGQRTGPGYALRAGGEKLTDIGLKMVAQSDRKPTSTPPPTTQPRRRNIPPASLTQSFEMSGDSINEEPKFPTTKPKSGDWSKLTVGGVTKIWDPETNSYQLPGTINKRLKSQGEKLITVPGRAPVPAKPKVPGLPPSAAQPGQGPKGNEVGSKPQSPPAPPSGDGGGTRRPPAAPVAPARQPAPQASPVASYVKAAAAARKSGDPAEMAKVRDMGMEIWRKANPKLAAAADERARIRGTAQTDNPLMKDMRDRLPLTPSVQSPTLKKDLGLGQQSLTQNPNAAIAATPKPAPVTRASVPLQNPTVSEPLPKATQKPEEKPVKKTVNSSYEYDAYDLVLEYLLSEGHADTVSEANYIMLQMSAEHIQDIVEVSGEWFRGIFNSKNSAASRAQNTSPFNRQTQPLPSTTSPFAKPASYTDSGKLTPYGAGGGAAAERAGQTRTQVMQQGAKNLENKKRVDAPDPNFGR